MSDRDSPFINERSPSYRRAWKEWKQRGQTADGRDGEAVGGLQVLLDVERDMVSALQAARRQRADEDNEGMLARLIAEHFDRRKRLERWMVRLGAVADNEEEPAGLLPHDADELHYRTGHEEILAALEENYLALADWYRNAIELASHRKALGAALDQWLRHCTRNAARLRELRTH